MHQRVDICFVDFLLVVPQHLYRYCTHPCVSLIGGWRFLKHPRHFLFCRGIYYNGLRELEVTLAKAKTNSQPVSFLLSARQQGVSSLSDTTVMRHPVS